MKPTCPRERRHRRFLQTAPVAVSIAVTAFLPSQANTYQFINPATYPAPNVSSSAVSVGTAIETATRRTPASAMELEARYRTIDESCGVALRSDEARGGMIKVQ